VKVNSPAADQIRILIVDDHALFREGLAELLNKIDGFRVVGRCAATAEALEIMAGAAPAVVLLDFDLGVDRAFDFLDKARAAAFAGSVLIVTAGVSDAEAVRLVQAGVSGILHKHNPPEELCEVIRQISSGEVCLEKHYLKSLFRTVDQTRTSQLAVLTDRDKSILRMVFQGLGNKEIGARLELSEGTVKASLRQLFQKLGVRTRGQLVKVALEEYRDQL
jgi:two-component system nitrate/nitrite response regulator NarL